MKFFYPSMIVVLRDSFWVGRSKPIMSTIGRNQTCVSRPLYFWGFTLLELLVVIAIIGILAALLTLQKTEIRDLKATPRGLSEALAAAEPARPAPAAGADTAEASAEASAKVQAEITRLNALAAQLAAEVSQLEQLSTENQQLRAQAAKSAAGYLTPAEAEGLAAAKEKAMSIRCVNNLKQMGLAVRIWAIDNGGVFPPNVLCMSNELSTPLILVCPADTGRQSAKDWASYTSANWSYEYLAPSAPETEPSRVMFRCPIHRHVGLCDGSVQMGVANKHPERLVQRDGKLYFDDGQTSPQVTSAPPSSGAKPDSQP
jgi:prepilin-type N-terminal cleavage/methylation domain-containing protein